MPLIIVTGLPSSGKTHRAQQVFADFQSRISSTSSTTHIPNGLTVQHLTSTHASQDKLSGRLPDSRPRTPSNNPRDVIYNSAREEKTARAEEFSATKRALSKNNIVIVDAPNYIKGFRYQMWCEAKAVGTRSVVIHAAAREDECKTWNEDRIRAWGWTEPLQTENEQSNITSNAKIGKDVRGELQPESHTAIFGDRPTDVGRSRSSSMDGYMSEDEDRKRKDLADTMTLKSLFISDKKPDSETNGQTGRSKLTEDSGIISEEPTSTAPSTPPLPSASLPYSSATFESLAMRYEPPSPFTRWDTPLFTVPSEDVHPPYQAIWDALFPPVVKPTKKVISQLRAGEVAETKPDEVRSHAATVLPKATGAEALQTLESATSDTVKMLLASARDKGLAEGEGGSLVFSVPDPKNSTEIHIEIEIPLNLILSQPALQRLRRKYTQIQRGGIAHGQGYISGRSEIVKDFSKFVQAEWDAE